MNRRLMFIPLLFLASGLACAAEASNEERSLLQVEAAACHAFEVGDAVSLRKMLDAGFTLTSSTGAVTGLQQNLAEVAAREPAYSEFRNHDQHVRLYGDAAVITGITTVKGRSGSDAFAADFQYTDTWIQRGGRWLLVASHASRLPARP